VAKQPKGKSLQKGRIRKHGRRCTQQLGGLTVHQKVRSVSDGLGSQPIITSPICPQEIVVIKGFPCHFTAFQSKYIGSSYR